MIRSMTGFARRERQGPWGTLVCELRTVNHRYLETSLRLPEELKALDNDVRPIRRAFLYEAHGDGGARARIDALPIAQTRDFVVRPAQCQMQKADGIEHR